MNAPEVAVERAQEHARRHGLTLIEQLGYGVHGSVFAAKCQPQEDELSFYSAVKAHKQEADYRRERDIYRRLQRKGITTIRGCHVPELVRHDDDLLIIEMTIVTRPFLLDFAGAFLDKAPDFSEEVMADWLAEKREQFDDRWPEVAAILRTLEGMGIHYIDVSPKNISLPE